MISVSSIPPGENANIYDRAAQNVGSGLVNLLESPLKNTKKQLSELEEKQTELVRKLHNENLSISDVQHCQDLQAMFAKMKLYHSKLHQVKKDMKSLHERSLKLKKRALKLKELKEKEPYEEIIITKPMSIISVKGGSAEPLHSETE